MSIFQIVTLTLWPVLREPSSQGVGFHCSLKNIVQSEIKIPSNFKQLLDVPKENPFALDVRPCSVQSEMGARGMWICGCECSLCLMPHQYQLLESSHPSSEWCCFISTSYPRKRGTEPGLIARGLCFSGLAGPPFCADAHRPPSLSPADCRPSVRLWFNT